MGVGVVISLLYYSVREFVIKYFRGVKWGVGVNLCVYYKMARFKRGE